MKSTTAEVMKRAGTAQNGATWQRVDLHLHSPGIEKFTCPNLGDPARPEVREKIARAYVERLLKADISVGAITDYNGIQEDWFVALSTAARDSGITLLPGVEADFAWGKGGLHVLTIFESGTPINEVNHFFQGFDRDPSRPLFDADGRHRDINPRDHISESLRQLRSRFDSIVIFPHPADDKGVFRTLKPGEAAKLLLDVRPDALEHCPLEEWQRIVSTNVLSRDFVESIPTVEFSDPKAIDQIGTKVLSDGTPRATFLKLSACDVSALRFALQDAPMRVRIGSVPPSTHPRIESVVVTGSGFLGNLEIDWNDDLNVIIGGRGAGKSALLETLRYALDIRAYSDSSYREELVRHALGSGGQVRVVLERPMDASDTRLYRVSRVLGQRPEVVDDSNEPVNIVPAELLGPEGGPTIFGQREIYAVSSSEEYRLALLDELIGEEARSRADAVRAQIEKLRQNARAIADARSRIAKRDEYKQRLLAINHEISVYEKHRAAEKLREATRLRGDEQYLRAAVTAVQKAEVAWMQAKDDVTAPLLTAQRNLARAESAKKEILGRASATIGRLVTKIDAAHAAAITALQEASGELRSLHEEWQDALRPLEEEINKIKRETQTETLDPNRLLKLTEDRATFAPLVEDLDRAESQLGQLERLRQQMISQLRELRHDEHKLRRERADAIGARLQGRLRVNIEFKGQKEDYRERLMSLLKGSRVNDDAIRQLIAPEATDGIAVAEAMRAGTEKLQKEFGLTPTMAQRLADWCSDDRFFELETLIPGDSVKLELKVDDQYRPMEKLSVGQRATAVLLLLFALEGRVLVLDQPEDDLDNRFVYDDIVQILRQQKSQNASHRRRQVIAVTHNPNIPVLGDAELVLPLEAREGKAYVASNSSVDDTATREAIKSIMEGGEEAFRRRVEKYGGWRASS